MPQKVVPMLHVPDVRATLEWYRSIGFIAERVDDQDGDMSWALVSFGPGEVMFSEGGVTSTAHRREVDLYVHVDDVEKVYRELKDRVEVVVDLYTAFYGMREFIIRDCNRFWITFGQPAPEG